jgi:hypothetical protein
MDSFRQIMHGLRSKASCVCRILLFILTTIDGLCRVRSMQSVNKYMLQNSVVDRPVHSEHILLIHPCSWNASFWH